MTCEKLKRGYVHPETGMVFWAYYKNLPNGEYWVNPETLAIKNKKSLEIGVKWRLLNKEKCRAYHKQRYIESPWKVNEANRKWQEKNKEKVRQNARRYSKEREKIDPIYAVKRRVRARTAKAFYRYGYTDRSSTKEIVGCDWVVLKEHIESKFKDGMSWENRNLWHVDHIIPLSSAKSMEELISLCHYTNLQPLWAVDNMKKSNKLILEKQTNEL